MRILALLTALLLSFAARAQAPAPAELEFVVVDATNPAYTVFLALPAGIPSERKERMRERVEKTPGTALVGWQDFQRDAQATVVAKIARNEYPEVRLADDVVALLAKYPATPFGVTWNGGLAVTRNDYAFAQQAYARYLKDPAQPARAADRRADPVHPQNHTGPLLGR